MTFFAALQLNSGAELSANLARAIVLTRQAATAGAKVIAWPETFSYIGSKASEHHYRLSLQSPEIQSLAELSQELGIYLLAGSFHEIIPNSSKLYNTSVFFSPEGQVLSVYRKIHLFDIQAPFVTLRESDDFAAGDSAQAEVIQTPFGQCAVSICYDLRFPELYRRLSAAGAQIIFVPAAFTLQTGKDHWEVLLRARAIENQVYIVAPNQWGSHGHNRHSYGHSMIIDPWGHILAQASDKEGWIMAEIDLDYLAQVRQNLPCLSHRRLP